MTISYAPSCSVLEVLQNRNRDIKQSIVAFGNPAPLPKGLRPLPGTEREVNLIAQRFPQTKAYIGHKATKQEALSAMREAGYVHIACHATLDKLHPMKSGLQFAGSTHRESRLTVSEIFHTSIDTGLVVLSCCQSAGGEPNRGDEIVGISRAFLYAGASAVLVTLWDIEDKSAQLFMREFYEQINRMEVVDALQMARRMTRREFPHPIHWAPFVLIGLPSIIGRQRS